MCVAESLHSQGGSGAASAAGGVLPRPGFVSFEGLDLLAASLAPTEPCDGPGQRVTVLPQRQEGGWNQGSRGGGGQGPGRIGTQRGSGRRASWHSRQEGNKPVLEERLVSWLQPQDGPRPGGG